MLKNIATAIEHSLSQEEEKTMSILKFKENNIWKLKVNVKMGYSHNIDKIERVGRSIADFYGSPIHTFKTKHTILFS